MDRRFTESDAEWVTAARQRISQLTMPAGALARLEGVMVDLVRIQRTLEPSVRPAHVAVFAADHGYTRLTPVSAYPREVTGQMVRNLVAGGAAVTVLARHAGHRVTVVDMGVDGPPADASDGDHSADLRNVRLMAGTHDMRLRPAMDPSTVDRAVDAGRQLVADHPDIRCWMPGEMAIGNTTASAALASLLLGLDPNLTVGRGTGIDDARLVAKRELVAAAIRRYASCGNDPCSALAAVGGLEIAGMVGVYLAAADRRTPVLVDGLISAVAALVADRICPKVKEVLFAGHRSPEPAHRPILAELGISPMLDLGLRLGEGSGALLAWPLLDAACHLFADMATFQSAGVSNRGK